MPPSLNGELQQMLCCVSLYGFFMTALGSITGWCNILIILIFDTYVWFTFISTNNHSLFVAQILPISLVDGNSVSKNACAHGYSLGEPNV